jgi:hypothetical protein
MFATSLAMGVDGGKGPAIEIAHRFSGANGFSRGGTIDSEGVAPHAKSFFVSVWHPPHA